MLYSVLMLALRSVRRNLLRSFLTILGIVIGVSAVITMQAKTVIQNEIAKVGVSILVRRSSWVPSAQVAAAVNAKATPRGFPLKPIISCHSSSDTPKAAAATPSQLRLVMTLAKNSAPKIAEKIGMV